MEIVRGVSIGGVERKLTDSYVDINMGDSAMKIIKSDLVYGGTPDPWSNRMIENLNYEVLYFVDLSTVDQYRKSISECTSVDGLKHILLDLDKNNMNIVGSRGYVYQSAKQAEVCEELLYLVAYPKDLIKSITLLTRTLGIRVKFWNLATGDTK